MVSLRSFMIFLRMLMKDVVYTKDGATVTLIFSMRDLSGQLDDVQTVVEDRTIVLDKIGEGRKFFRVLSKVGEALGDVSFGSSVVVQSFPW